MFAEQVLAEVIHQFKQNKDLRVTLTGTDYRGSETGSYFHQAFDPGKFPESTVLKVRLAPMLPKDDLRAADIFGKLTVAGGLSKLTARSQFLGVRNPLAEEARIQQDLIREHPIWQGELLLEAMWQNVQRREADAEAATDPAEKRRLTKAALRARLLYDAEEARLTGMAAKPPEMQPAIGGTPEPSVQPAAERVGDNPQIRGMLGGAGAAPTDNMAG